MNAEEILSDVQLIDLTHRDAQFVRAELIEKIDAAIAAAVAAEREACAKVEPGMDTDNVFGWDTMTPGERRMWKAGYSCAMDDFAAAIRARG